MFNLNTKTCGTCERESASLIFSAKGATCGECATGARVDCADCGAERLASFTELDGRRVCGECERADHRARFPAAYA